MRKLRNRHQSNLLCCGLFCRTAICVLHAQFMEREGDLAGLSHSPSEPRILYHNSCRLMRHIFADSVMCRLTPRAGTADERERSLIRWLDAN